ncbi:hypothetical protein GH714_038128 [Hevea brasiliensis]|uniref:Uncharacterized protein n=1 Tax=Hevea brasiliensis TaxID=3981 RepID=A0A6A6MPC5_HEVBR|nr:hypothetical protein GH714_038128 [Hevea brasiliensis]
MVELENLITNVNFCFIAEPPDIRNWFPSYRYESFVLDTYEFKENNRFDVLVVTPFRLDPPHIRNCFSSYVYESPVLNTLDDFKESVTKESECAKEGFAFEGSKRKREDNYESRNSWNSNEVDTGGGLCSNGLVNCENSFEDTRVNKPSNEVPHPSESPSALSEPPDIRNWFSSYVYESPGSNGFVDKEADCEDLVNQHNNNEKERNLRKFGQTRITDESIIDEKGMRALVNGNSSARDNLCCERRQSLEDKIFPSHRVSSTNDIEKASLNDDCPPYKPQQKQNFLQEALLVTCQRNTNSSANARPFQTKLNLMKDLAENLKTEAEKGVDEHLGSPTTSQKFVQVAGDLIKKSTCENNNKENEGKEVLDSGSVTTKNRWITNEENSLHKPLKILSECSRNKRITSDCGNNAIERKVLSERTNLERIDATEITGKWRCPQKTKPNIGPPLKQLRLERWVHRL